MIYFDTSVLVAYYCPEPISQEVEAMLIEIKHPAISSLTEVELCSAVSRKVRENNLSENDANRVLSKFQSHIQSQLFRCLSLQENHFQKAKSWISQFKKPLRTLDALHLALVSNEEMILCTADIQLGTAAEFFGIDVQLIKNNASLDADQNDERLRH